MSLIEFIGFAISLIALVFLSLMKKKGEDSRKLHSEEEELSEEDSIVNFFNSLSQETKEKVPPPSKPASSRPLPKPIHAITSKSKKGSSYLEKQLPKSSIEARRLKSELEHRRLETPLTGKDEHVLSPEELLRRQPRAASFVKRLSHLRDIVIYQAIIGKPKGLE